MPLDFLIRYAFVPRLTGRMLVCIIPLLFSLAPLNVAAQQDLFDHFKRVDDESELKAGETKEGKVKKNFFLQAEVSKTECFAGEAIMATFKAYSRLNANSQVVKRPSLSGFSVIEMVDAYSNQPDIEKVNGKYFYSHLIRKVQLIPLQPGEFNLEGAEVESVIHFTRNREQDESALNSLRNFLRRAARPQPDGDESLDYRISLETPPIGVRVMPLPPPDQGIDFSGAVGQFSVDLDMTDTKITAHQPVVARLTVKGTGNFPLITEPPIRWPEGIEASIPSVSEEVNKYVFPLAGTKTFEYVLEAGKTGEFTIPPVQFSYFDPQTKTYRVVETQAVKYTVIPGGDNRSPVISGNTDSIPYATGLPRQLFWFGGVAAIIIGWIIFQLIKLKKDKGVEESLSEKITVARKATAETQKGEVKKEALDKHLALAKAALNQSDEKTFYNQVQSTVWEAIGSRYSLAPATLTKRIIVQLLNNDHFPDQVMQDVIGLLNECDLKLYTPGQNQADMQNAYLTLESSLKALQTNYQKLL